MSIPTSPIAPARQWLFDQLRASTALATYTTSIWPRQPEEGTPYPMVFLTRSSSVVITPVGTDRIDDNGLTDINIVGDRRQSIDDMDRMLNAVLAAIHHTRGTNSLGSVSACKVENIFDIPYPMADDVFPRQIVRTRTYSAGV